MQRVLSTTVLLGLLIATAAAFAITERLKLVKSPIYGTHVSKRLSPTCGCARGKAKVTVKLRHGDDVTVRILDAGGQTVRTLVSNWYEPRGQVSWAWDGATDAGGRAPDGVYRPEVHLAQAHRTILLPNRIVLDTHPPRVLDVTASRSTISPDGDNVGDSIHIHYKLNSPAHVLVYLGSTRVIYGRSHKPQGTVVWHGRDADGKPLKAGTYTLYVGAVDLAGNLVPVGARRPLVVRVRYIQLVPDRVVVHKPGVRFAVGVDTDAHHYWWKLNGRHGVGSGPTLVLRAPKKAGTYRIAIGERAYTYHGTLVVGAGR